MAPTFTVQLHWEHFFWTLTVYLLLSYNLLLHSIYGNIFILSMFSHVISGLGSNSKQTYVLVLCVMGLWLWLQSLWETLPLRTCCPLRLSPPAPWITRRRTSVTTAQQLRTSPATTPRQHTYAPRTRSRALLCRLFLPTPPPTRVSLCPARPCSLRQVRLFVPIKWNKMIEFICKKVYFVHYTRASCWNKSTQRCLTYQTAHRCYFWFRCYFSDTQNLLCL